MLIDYTSFDEVRAVLGVSPEELEDETLVQPIYEYFLINDLEDIGSTLIDEYKTVKAIGFSSRTAAQRRLHDLTRLFAAVAVARQLLSSLPYFGEKRVQDGRAEKERIQDSFKNTKEGVEGQFGALRLRLSAAYVAIAGGTALSRTTVTMMSSTGLATDPVTNT